jgi:hypothetical protein
MTAIITMTMAEIAPGPSLPLACLKPLGTESRSTANVWIGEEAGNSESVLTSTCLASTGMNAEMGQKRLVDCKAGS